MSTRGKKSTEKTKQNAASVKSAAASGGKKKPEQAGPQKPADKKDKATGQKQEPTGRPGLEKGSDASEIINAGTDINNDGA